MSNPELTALVRRVQEQARVLATRADGSVDADLEIRLFRKLITEAAAED